MRMFLTAVYVYMCQSRESHSTNCICFSKGAGDHSELSYFFQKAVHLARSLFTGQHSDCYSCILSTVFFREKCVAPVCETVGEFCGGKSV